MHEHVHFVGIGGIGVSAIARFYRSQGSSVSGSDIAQSEVTDALKKVGVKVFIGSHRASNVSQNATRLIYSEAATHDNPEIQKAHKLKIPSESGAEALGRISNSFDAVAISGAHGKSTTTALIAVVLVRAGLDPTVVVGTKLREFKNTNFRKGRSRWFVVEADDYKAKLLHYHPKIAVITNIDREHMDVYKSIAAIERAFFTFLTQIQRGGTAVLNHDDQRLRRLGTRLKKRRKDVDVVWYSLRDSGAKRLTGILAIPGRHNVSNALAAFKVGKILKIPEQKIFSALREYHGAWRRFDYQGIFAGAKVFADYAHHPVEIKATLQGVREKFPNARIYCVFQPHHYERTKDLFPEFAKAFDSAATVLLLDIYEVAGRERRRGHDDISSEKLARAVKRQGINAVYVKNQTTLRSILKKELSKDCVLLMMGAGTIWEMTKALMKFA